MGAEIISDVYDLTGDINDSGLTYTEELNTVGSLEFTLPLDHSIVTTDNFDVGRREVYLYRNDGTGEQRVFGGRLWTVDVDGWEGRFICYDFLHDLERRIIHDDYAQTSRDMYDIVWDLISATQARTNGGLGLTRDFTTLGKSRKFVVCMEERRTILDALTELASSKASFDFRVAPDKKVQLYADHRGTESVVTFNDANMGRFRHQRDATNMETVVAAIGPKEDCDIPSLYESTSSNTATYGVLDGTIDDEDIEDDNVREDTADEQLRLNEVPRLQPDVTLETPLQERLVQVGSGYDIQFNDVGVGDVVGVSTVSVTGDVGGFRDFNGSFRVLKKTVSVQKMGIERVDFGLDQVIL